MLLYIVRNLQAELTYVVFTAPIQAVPRITCQPHKCTSGLRHQRKLVFIFRPIKVEGCIDVSNMSEFLAQGNYVSTKWRYCDSNLGPPDHDSNA